MRLTLAILWSGLGLGCGQSDELVSDAITPPNASQKRTALADTLVYDETAERVYQVGEAIPYTGNVVWFHENGLLQQETSYQDGREHGPTIWWHEDGSRAGQSMHANGVLNGPLIQWHPGGTAKELQVMYDNGRQVGREVWWHANGREQSITPYVAGNREGKAMGWFVDGTKSWESVWVKDEPQGQYLEWYSSGQIKSVKTYAQGIQHGIETWFYESGGKSYEVNWVEGKKEGGLTEWYESGAKMSETIYREDLKNETAIGWYESGLKAYETQYFMDEEVAVREWTEAGEIVPAPPVPLGLVRTWKVGEIEQFYKDRAQNFVFIAFGQPNKVEGDTWLYNNIAVEEKFCSVLFTFANNMVAAISVTAPDES